MATLNSVECLRIENRTRPQKQRIYWLLLRWSDGSVLETEKSHSALLDFRRTLKKNYGDSRDIHIPEVPSLKMFEIGNASKKDEKRRKSVEEFFRQLMKLPKLFGRVDPVMEFFASSLLQHDRVHRPADLTTLYAEVSRPNLNGGAKARNIDYVALDIQQPDDINGVSSSVPLSVPAVDTLYAEIAPNATSGLTTISVPSTKPHTGMKNCMDNIQYSSVNTKGRVEVASSSSVIPLFNKRNKEPANAAFDTVQPAVNGSITMNQSYVGPEYQNFPIATSIPSEDQKLYIVTQSFIPSTACSQYLAVENGDIVEIQAASGDKVFCTLHMTQLRLIEGWLPKNILKCVPPDFRLQSSNTSASIPLKSSVHSTDFHSQGQQSLEEEEDGNSAMAKTTKLRNASYFVGFLSRHDCENLLLAQGKQLDFIIRESPNLVGHFAISVKHDDHVHHFPIVLTEDNKFYIGKHHFKTVDSVITYYQRNDLFVDENGSVVRLGNPLKHNLQDDFK